ncbi:cysteine/glutathione ABC transporter permease/ATP-binding protein CydD [Erwinia tracheiphila]|uniref:ABC-type xenobiotic transporter n=1 Tax=Erwinia tracheiphila TaxID=65700 RepID=A0A0M2K6G9_9GAMM|nr:cysteine/glutathione ABC transporter permease/ATP-binding protein CydD [Erwinia tracheiphila]KKF34985.1 amino acid ABC transporter permease [Erwinia tracheiphila]UIA86651.1 cysteine/glutathione ABC transporter permease/ATP-binding protein CydD [Erwinia tracheiphila]UIA95006.1 cysteine/glutathione ABC transporter permease/ATP-binding protein CydD [Erwinia tracheiphila]
MNKSRQQQLLRWLKCQSVHGKGWLRLSQLLGIFSALFILAQAWLMADMFQSLIVDNLPRENLFSQFIMLIGCFFLRALLVWLREKAGFEYGNVIRRNLRENVLNRLEVLGPAWIQGKPAGTWATLLLEQIEDMQDYFARYLPQMLLATLIPCLILLILLPINWVAAVILFVTAPLIPLFMALAGMGAADANRRNFKALARLSGHFLDRLRGLDTLRLFYRAEKETQDIRMASTNFRQHTMAVLRLAFLSSAVLEFFASLSIAVVAVYFGFSYLGELNFGHYGHGVTLFAGFLALILAPEFFLPLRELGTFYHAKAQAIGGADALEAFLTETAEIPAERGEQEPDFSHEFNVVAEGLRILSPHNTLLAGPLNFTLSAGKRVVLIGQSGAGKTSLLNVLLGNLPYQGSLRVNGVELRDVRQKYWHQHLAWVGQNPHLPANTLAENIAPDGSRDLARLQQICDTAAVTEFIPHLPDGLASEIGEQADKLSVGQTQRVAVARALYKSCKMLLLDEPTASLDSRSEYHVNKALIAASYQHTTLLVTHHLHLLHLWDEIWLMHEGRLVQQGNVEQLSQEGGLFAQLISRDRG